MRRLRFGDIALDIGGCRNYSACFCGLDGLFGSICNPPVRCTTSSLPHVRSRS